MKLRQAPSDHRPYVYLAILFAVVMISQVSFTVDVVRVWFGGYPASPVGLGSPWPAITYTGPAAAAAGLRVGDRVESVEGRPLRGWMDFQQPLKTRRPGENLAITVTRDGHSLELHPQLRPVLLGRGEMVVLYLLLPWFCIALGFWVAGVRPHDPLAWLTLGILAGLSQLVRPAALDPLGWPALVGVTTVVFRELMVAIWAISMMCFGLFFPKRSVIDARAPWLKWLLVVPLTAGAIWDSIRDVTYAVAYHANEHTLPPNPIPPPVLFAILQITISVFFVALGLKHGDRSLDKDDRRRLKLLQWGCTVAMAPLAIVLFSSLIIQHRQPWDRPITTWCSMALILFPLTMAYVIVVERAMDVRMVIRQGVQYALARRGVRILQAALTIAIVLGSADILDSTRMSRPEKFTLIAAGVALVLRIRDLGERLRRWVDRRFFREAYNAEEILGELSEQVRGILDRQSLLETVAHRISESLHVERIAVLLRQNGAYRPALALGYPAVPDVALAPDHPAISDLRRRQEPLSGGEEFRPLAAELLLPLASHKDLLGFISLGPKRSEEPYSPSDTSLLRTVALQTGLALENSRLSEAIAAEVAQRELLNREIEIAREVQQRLFPQNLPEVPSLRYAGYCRPARGVGGDYYDFLALNGGRLGLAIGDISGKGVPAALLMASLQASVRGQSQSEAGRVAELMTNVNRLVCDATPENRYATFFYGQFDTATRRLVYSNGGHNAPMILRRGSVIRLESGGPPVGLFRFSKYAQDEVQLEPGDLLLLFTDGISEAENPAEEEWGEDALIAAARSSGTLPPGEIIARIMQAADAFAAGAPQHDDMTVVVARVTAD